MYTQVANSDNDDDDDDDYGGSSSSNKTNMLQVCAVTFTPSNHYLNVQLNLCSFFLSLSLSASYSICINCNYLL